MSWFTKYKVKISNKRNGLDIIRFMSKYADLSIASVHINIKNEKELDQFKKFVKIVKITRIFFFEDSFTNIVFKKINQLNFIKGELTRKEKRISKDISFNLKSFKKLEKLIESNLDCTIYFSALWDYKIIKTNSKYKNSELFNSTKTDYSYNNDEIFNAKGAPQEIILKEDLEIKSNSNKVLDVMIEVSKKYPNKILFKNESWEFNNWEHFIQIVLYDKGFITALKLTLLRLSKRILSLITK
jgi:hypothetical protein